MLPFEDQLVTHMFAPSNAMPIGTPPTSKLPRFAPSLARSFVTVPSLFAVQILAPSKAIPYGLLFWVLPTVKLFRAKLAWYHLSCAILSGLPAAQFLVGTCAPLLVACPAALASCARLGIKLATATTTTISDTGTATRTFMTMYLKCEFKM